MARFVIRRLLAAVPVFWGAATIAFLAVHLLPGDPATLLLMRAGASAEEIAARRALLGWDRPLVVQYGAYLLRLLRGDLGRSWVTGQPVAQMLAQQWPRTLELTLSAMGIAVALGVVLGTVAALRWGTWVDTACMAVALVGVSTPVAWTGLLGLWLFSLSLGWLPPGGLGGPLHLVLPASVLGLASAGPIARLIRSGLIDALAQPFMTAAKAKGLPPGLLLMRHAFPVALPPTLAMMALQFGFLLGGAAVTEALFARPGLGRLAVEAVLNQDLPVVQGVVLLGAAFYLLANLVADMIQWLLDPLAR